MTGLPALLHFFIISFLTIGIFSTPISMPKSPRPIIMPSTSSMILLIFSNPSLSSILAIILAFDLALSKMSRSSDISSGRRTKEQAIKSTLFLNPNSKSSLSFLVRELTDNFAPGKLTPLFPFISPPIMTLQTISLPFMFIFSVVKHYQPAHFHLHGQRNVIYVNSFFVADNFFRSQSESLPFFQNNAFFIKIADSYFWPAQILQ